MNRILPFLLFLITAFSANAQDTLWMEVYYYSDKDQLPRKDQEALLKNMPSEDTVKVISYRIESTCDDIGSEEYNQDLSMRRSRNLAAVLQAEQNYSLAPELVGNGEKPLSPNNIDSFGIFFERQANRSSRVILIYESKYAIPAYTKIAVSQPSDSILNFENLQVGQKMVLANILFVGGHDEFLPESYSSLDTLLRKLKANPTFHIKIIGHVCCSLDGGDGEDLETGVYNLSKMRAQVVYLFLVNKGIDKTRLSFEGRGGSEPLGKGPKYDRRVELEIVSK